MSGEPSSNVRKYRDGNPVVRWLLGRFLSRVVGEAGKIAPAMVLDAGCGEGMVLERLAAALPEACLSGFDLAGAAVEEARARVPRAEVRQASIMAIPWPDRAFDLVVCCEVLEHLEEPERGLRELARVARGELLLTVPHEPWFRLGNLARGRHVWRWGNHPEHVQQWDMESFRQFAGQVVEVRWCESVFPWILLRGTVVERGRG